MLRAIQWLVVIGSITNIWLYWDTDAVGGWVVALVGWLTVLTNKK